MTYYLHNGQLFEIDRMPPDMINRDWRSEGPTEQEYADFHTYLSTLQSIPHTFTGENRVVPGDQIEWVYEAKITFIESTWIETSEEKYNGLPDDQRRRVATPKITEEGKDEWRKAIYKGDEFPDYIGREILVADDNSNPKFPCYKIKFVGENEEIDNMSEEDIEWPADQPDKQGEDGYDYEDDPHGEFDYGIRCVFCDEECKPAPTERGWSSVRYGKGLHFDCAEKVASQGRRLTSSPSPTPETGEKEKYVEALKKLLRIADCPESLIENPFIFGKPTAEDIEWANGVIQEHKSQQPHSPVQALTTDQEAAEKWISDHGVKFMAIEQQRNAFLAGCTHVRAQQGEEIEKLKFKISQLEHQIEDLKHPF